MTALDTLSAPREPLPARAAVLVVDDNAAKRMAVQAMLAPLGYDVFEADSGRAALRAVMGEQFAVILMDVRMPTMDGYETARLIRERMQSELTPIIFLTAFGQDETETASAYASGAVDFIFTPIRADILRAKVGAFMDLFLQAQRLQESLASITALNAELRDAHASANAVLQNVGDAIVTADADGVIGSFNRAARVLFGYSEVELVGRPLRSIIAPGDADAEAEPVGRRKDGSSFPLEMDVTETQIRDRTITIACIRDISERTERADRERQRAQEVHRGAQRDRAAFDEAPIGSVIATRDGRIERVNQAFCEMTGYTAEALVGQDFLWLTHADDRERSAGVVALVSGSDHSTQRFETRYVHADGHIVEGRIAITSIRDDADQATQLFAQIEDITDARRTSRELEQAQYEMLARLAAVAEFRDDDTGQHTRRVGDLSVAIAERLGLPEAQLDLMRLAAPLHDVGKIAIPDAILGKPGKLSDAEFDEMKTHTSVGSQMLAGSGFALLELAEEIALTHHEKWNGSGYPAGLSGEAIPIVGRIVAVADVFDALTHERPYKAAWSVADAVAEMTEQAGRHFDPAVLEAFFSLELT